MPNRRLDRRLLFLLVCALAAAPFPAAAGDATPGSPSAGEIITGLQEFQTTLGFPETGNFKKQSGSVKAYYRCYYTGKLELPASYDDLDLRQGEGNCNLDPEKYDIFFYPIEAVASGKAPVTASLAQASIERLLVVVPHEDFHGHKELRDVPAAAGEAAATLAGFLTAAEFARTRFGENSQVYRNLAAEPELFLRKSEVVNRHYGELERLYAEMRAGRVSRDEALAAKQQAYARLERECKAIQPDPTSFNKCPGALNNAGLAFDRTYTEAYSFVWGIYLGNGRDPRATIAALQRIGSGEASGAKPRD